MMVNGILVFQWSHRVSWNESALCQKTLVRVPATLSKRTAERKKRSFVLPVQGRKRVKVIER